MSFSVDVKEEICKIAYARHCNLALLSSLLLLNSDIKEQRAIKIYNNKNQDLIDKLIAELFGLPVTQKYYDDILNATGLKDGTCISDFVIKNMCCKKEFVKGAFICCGSITNPEKSYHLELVFLNNWLANDFNSLLITMGFNSKVIKRKQHHIVYLKDGESISLFLNTIGAHKNLLKFENVRIIKEIRNDLNRQVNCEAENIRKTIAAASSHIEDINYIIEKRGLDFLPKDLQNIAILRLNNSDATLANIGELSHPKLSKASVNYKLKKINKIAENIRGGLIK